MKLKYFVYRDKNGVKKKVSINSKKVKGGNLTDEDRLRITTFINTKFPIISSNIDIIERILAIPNIQAKTDDELLAIIVPIISEIRYPNETKLDSFKNFIKQFLKANKIQDDNDTILNDILDIIKENKKIKDEDLSIISQNEELLMYLIVPVLIYNELIKDTTTFTQEKKDKIIDEVEQLFTDSSYRIQPLNEGSPQDDILINNLLYIINLLYITEKTKIKYKLKLLELIIKHISATKNIILRKNNEKHYESAIREYIHRLEQIKDNLITDPNHRYNISDLVFYEEMI
jgi:hypothetical protein